MYKGLKYNIKYYAFNIKSAIRESTYSVEKFLKINNAKMTPVIF